MGFTPTYDNLEERQPWQNTYYNTLIDNLQAKFGTLSGTDLSVPLRLLATNQHLDGVSHNIYLFKRWFGDGTQTVSVRDVVGFGAKGDGSTDDRAAIQSAIDDLPATGGCVLVPPGVYVLGGALNMKGTGSTRNNVAIMGFGPSSTLKLKNATNTSLIELASAGVGNYMLVANLKIDGNDANQSVNAAGISTTNSNYSAVQDCWIGNVKGDGIIINASHRLRVSRCHVYSTTRNGISHGSGATQGSFVTIEGCTVRTAGLVGIDLEFPPTDCIVRGNLITACASHGIQALSIDSTTFARLIIDGNMVVDNGTGGGGNDNGIVVTAGIPATISDIVITNNLVKGHNRDGILVDGGTSAPIYGVSIVGNVCTGNTVHGIAIERNIQGATVTGNSCRNNGSYGINVQGTTAALAAKYISITGNTCFDDQAVPTQDYGIALGGYSENCVAIGNTVWGNVTANILNNGTTNEVAHNPGF